MSPSSLPQGSSGGRQQWAERVCGGQPGSADKLFASRAWPWQALLCCVGPAAHPLSSGCTRVPSLASPGVCACHSLPSVIGSCISACISEDCPFESLSARNPFRMPPSVPCQASLGARGECSIFDLCLGSCLLVCPTLPRTPVHPSESHLPLHPLVILNLSAVVHGSLLYQQDQPGHGQRGTADWGERTQ